MAWKAPTDGWRTDIPQTDMGPTDASTLINFFPEPGYARVRNGCQSWATGMSGLSVQTLIPYSGVEQNLWAANNGQLWNVTSQGVQNSHNVTGMHSDHWSYAQMDNAAGFFLMCVNNASGTAQDYPHMWNGSSWNQMYWTLEQTAFSGTASGSTITGVTSLTGLFVGQYVATQFTVGGTAAVIDPTSNVYITGFSGSGPYTVTLSASAGSGTNTYYAYYQVGITKSTGYIASGSLSKIQAVADISGICIGMTVMDDAGLITQGTTVSSITGSAGSYTINLSGAASAGTSPKIRYAGSQVTPNFTFGGCQNFNVVTSYGARLWFLQQGSGNVYYGDTQNISGGCQAFNAAADTKFGGQLVALCPWTAQTVNGVIQFLLVMTSEGEVLVYEGTNPSDPTNWNLQGAFKLSWPVGGDRCMMPIGGDVAIMTTDGVVAASKAIALDPSASDQAAITARITPTWLQTVQQVGATTSGWQFTTYANARQAIVNVPGLYGTYQLVMNTETMAWTIFQGMPYAAHWVSWNNGLYFGSTDGSVYQADIGSTDNGTPITALYCGPWTRITMPFPAIADGLSPKRVTMVGADMNFDQNASIGVGASYDYVCTTPQYSLQVGGSPAVWGTAVWGSAMWFGQSVDRILGAGMGEGVVYAPTVVAYVQGSIAGTDSNCWILGGATYLEVGAGI